MSGEHFETDLLKEHSAEGTVFSRKYGMDKITTHTYVHEALLECAQSVADGEMDGISGDLPLQRKAISEMLFIIAVMTKDLAYDAASDVTFDLDKWENQLTNIRNIETTYYFNKGGDVPE